MHSQDACTYFSPLRKQKGKQHFQKWMLLRMKGIGHAHLLGSPWGFPSTNSGSYLLSSSLLGSVGPHVPASWAMWPHSGGLEPVGVRRLGGVSGRRVGVLFVPTEAEGCTSGSPLFSREEAEWGKLPPTIPTAYPSVPNGAGLKFREGTRVR